jgi:hypothetical protein
MPEQPWTVVVDGAGAVTERKLGDHEPGTLLAPSLTVVSNTVAAGVRTVVASRPLAGTSPDYFTFTTVSADATVKFISAVGSGSAFAYHKARTIGEFWVQGVGAALSLPEG